MNSTQSRVTLAALAATVLVGLSLRPLVQGSGWFVAILVVSGVVAGAGAATRQLTRAVPVVVAVQVVALLVALTALFARDTAIWGLIPGTDAVASLLELKDDGLEEIRRQAPPVTAERGILFLIAGGVGLVALLVDVIAVSLRRPAVAGLPLLLVYCVPAAVLVDGLNGFYFLVGGVGFLLLVASDAGDRIRGWGRVLDDGGRGATGALGGPLSGARRIGVTSLAVALVLPAFVPGLGDRLLDMSSGEGIGDGTGSGTVAVVNPILRLRDNLTARSDDVVITYRTTVGAPDPLRIVTDDEFTGEQWQPSQVRLPRSQRVQDGFPSPPGLSSAVQARTERTRIAVTNLAQTYLPLPYPPTRVDIDGGWLYDARTLNAVGDGRNTRNVSYEVTHLSVRPTAQQLRAAPPAPASIVEPYTRLPEGLPQEIRRIAVDQAGSGTDYEKALALQRWFRETGGFAYNEQVTAGDGSSDSGQDAVLAFLQNKQGYCVQFASAMAVLARAVGIPARVAVGFLPGVQRDDDTYAIALRDAHSWPELYFHDVGWVRFEPTPAVRARQEPAWTQQAGPSQTNPTPSSSVSAAVPTTSGSSVPNSADERGDNAADDLNAGATGLLERVPWRLVGVLALVVLLLATPLAASAVARRRRWARAETRTERAEAAWDDLRERLSDLGVTWAASWTPRALQLRLVGDHRLDGVERAALQRLVTELEEARYAPPGNQGRSPEELAGDVRLVVQGVAAGLPKSVRRRARWFPASGVAALTGMVRRVDAAADEAGRRAAALGSEVRRTVGSGGRRRSGGD